MSRIIVLQWESAAVSAAVLNPFGNRAEVEAVVSVRLEGDDESIGRTLAGKLQRFPAGKARVIGAVGRRLLAWQHILLPPCPDDDLPDLVRMQSDYNHSSSDDPAGLDFLPLVGDERIPHRAWAVSLAAAQLARIRRIVDAAELKVERLVPLALGWPAWARHIAEATDNQRANVSVAPSGVEPVIWANIGQRVVLFRQLQLPQADPESLAAAVAGEVRRTLLAFSQEQPQAGEPQVHLVGPHEDDLAKLAETLSGRLQRQINTVAGDAGRVSEVPLPALGLALDEAAGLAPAVDLLHPRRRPAPQTSRRTYALAAAAAASLLMLIGWRAYSNLRAPILAAEVAQAEIDLLNGQVGPLREAEQRANSIRTWLGGSVNLLHEMEVLSKHVRPEPLEADSFPADTDVVVGKVVLHNRQFTIDALAKENRVVQPLEHRLRDGTHRVQRGKTDRSDSLPEYPLAFQSIVDVTDPPPAEEAPRP